MIEILIAVLILALGLLGLGAVFPVVIREQKIAQDRIGGSIADNNIRAMLVSNTAMGAGTNPYGLREVLTPQGNPTTCTKTIRYRGWQALAEEWELFAWGSQPRPNFRFSADALWETDWGVPNNPAFTDYLRTGDLKISAELSEPSTLDELPPGLDASLQSNYPTVTNFEYVREIEESRLPLAGRLNSAGSSDADTPALVWDAVVRRLTPRSTTLQVAVFVRRVDPQIRTVTKPGSSPTRNYTLREAFLDPNASGSDRRLPVGEDSSGLPTLDGTDGGNGVQYSPVRGVTAEFNITSPTDNVRRDTIELPGVSDQDFALIRQIGQRLIDNMGNIYTVVGSSSAGARTLRVEPSVPASVTPSNDAQNNLNSPDYTVNAIRQLIFTPQIPVSVFVTEVRP